MPDQSPTKRQSSSSPWSGEVRLTSRAWGICGPPSLGGELQTKSSVKDDYRSADQPDSDQGEADDGVGIKLHAGIISGDAIAHLAIGVDVSEGLSPTA
jgi:hypothetical protein